MPATAPTRERLVNEAMRLFSAKGFDATSVSQIEAAAGLAPGSGALYHHFKSKEALLDAGIDRRQAMHHIRDMFAGLGNLDAELTVLGRYLLAVVDHEIELLQIAVRTTAGRSPRLDTAYAALVDGLNAELTDWINAWAPNLTQQQCTILAALGINSILGARLAASLFHQPNTHIPDTEYLTEWTAILTARIQALSEPDAHPSSPC